MPIISETGAFASCSFLNKRAGLICALRDSIDAAVLRIGGAQQVISTDHLSAVTDDPHQMAQIAAVHALGDIWAMGATPQAALASVILPRTVPAMQADWLAETIAARAPPSPQAQAKPKYRRPAGSLSYNI